MNVKTNNYYGFYMRVLQEMPKKPTAILETICGYCNEWRMSTIICALYAGIARNVKCQRLLWDSYAGIARNVKGQRYYGTYMRVLQLMQNACGYFGLICRYCIFRKWSYWVHNRKWCGYYMFKMCGLFKKSSGDVSLINLDVSIV